MAKNQKRSTDLTVEERKECARKGVAAAVLHNNTGMTIGDILTTIQKQGGEMPFDELFNIELRMDDELRISKVKFMKDRNAVYLVDFEEPDESPEPAQEMNDRPAVLDQLLKSRRSSAGGAIRSLENYIANYVAQEKSYGHAISSDTIAQAVDAWERGAR